MTYGENGNQIRAHLATLVRQHRIQHRIGGPGTHTVPASTTIAQRELLGEQIQRYRYAALAWCLHAAAEATPRIDLARTERARGPAEDLRNRLTESIKASNAGLPSMRELTAPQEFPMVECWRQVAKAAVLGEHDFGGLLDHGTLSDQQCMTVLKDAADVARALIVLDKRYVDIPGWIPIRVRGRLERVAEVCSVFAGESGADYTVDQRGWRPTSALIKGGPLPGVGGVLQAEHNMLVHLAHFPNAVNLRRLIDGQRILSHEGVRLAAPVDPHLAEKWAARELTYTRLCLESRSLGGLVGGGGHAVAEAATAVTRLRRVRVDEIRNPEQLHTLNKQFTRTDARLAAIIEHGAAERLYFVSIKAARPVDESALVAHTVRQQYVPISRSIDSDLITTVRSQLRPAPIPPAPPPEAAQGRQELRDSIEHRPQRRDRPIPQRTENHPTP